MQDKLDTNLNNFGPRLRAHVEGRGTIEQAYAQIGVSRATLFNWFGRDTPPPGENKVEKLRRYLGKEAAWILDNIQNPTHLKIGDMSGFGHARTDNKVEEVASRLPLNKRPSDRTDCEVYFQTLIDMASESDNPNAWPVIHDRLKKKFPLDEWAKTPPEGDS